MKECKEKIKRKGGKVEILINDFEVESTKKLIKKEKMAMLNNQQYITTELEKILYEILPITSKRLKNLVYIIIGIILSKSVVISDISEKLKDDFTDATEESKIKRI